MFKFITIMSRYLTSLRFAAAVILLLLSATRPAVAQDYSDNGSYQQFYDELSPYGEWVNDQQYGYVWVPDAGGDFRPYYSNGYWANTDYGNTWVSSYNWGWAPFHYGRWTYNNYYGWVWVPGNEWGPAWVSWRSGGGCYGWAPLGPGISVNSSFGNGYTVPDYWWTFTPQQYVLSPQFHQHSYGPRYNTNYIHQTTIINNTYVYNHNTYITGPRRNELERATGRPVQAVSINNSRRPDRTQLSSNSLSIYRPAIAESHPRATERPRQFRAAQQPIANTPREMAAPIGRTATQQLVRDRSQMVQQGGRPQQIADRPVRANDNTAIQSQEPRINRRQPDRVPVVQEREPIQQAGSGFDRQPVRTATQAPGQRIDPAPVNRNIEAPRIRQEQPQRIERPVMEQRQPAPQRMEQSPRMEAPRAVPQREMPASAPARIEQRPQTGGSDGRVLRGR